METNQCPALALPVIEHVSKKKNEKGTVRVSKATVTHPPRHVTTS